MRKLFALGATIAMSLAVLMFACVLVGAAHNANLPAGHLAQVELPAGDLAKYGITGVCLALLGLMFWHLRTTLARQVAADKRAAAVADKAVVALEARHMEALQAADVYAKLIVHVTQAVDRNSETNRDIVRVIEKCKGQDRGTS